MDELKKLLISKGVSNNALLKMDNDMIGNLAKAFNIDPAPYLPREVRLEKGKNGATYVVTSGYPVLKYKNKKPTSEIGLARNLYVRVEAIDDIIADLQAAKRMIGQD